MFKVIENNKSDFLHRGRLQQKEAITVGISKILVEVLKFFCLQFCLPKFFCLFFYLQVLVKMFTTDRKFYKESVGKLTYFVVENFYNHFLFLFFNLQLQVIICKNLVRKERGGGGRGGAGQERFGHFLTDRGSTNPNRL